MYIRRAGDLGALIRDRRKAAGLTQGGLAAKLGTSQRWVSELERGKPTAELEMALRAVNALGISLLVEPQSVATSESRAKPTRRGESQTAASAHHRVNVNDLVDD